MEGKTDDVTDEQAKRDANTNTDNSTSYIKNKNSFDNDKLNNANNMKSHGTQAYSSSKNNVAVADTNSIYNNNSSHKSNNEIIDIKTTTISTKECVLQVF